MTESIGLGAPGPEAARPAPSLPHARGDVLARNWWAIGLRGVFAVLFGLAALLLPVATLASLVLLFAAYMTVDGVFAIVAGLRAAARHERWGLLVLEGVADLLMGAVAFLLPGLTVLVLVTLLGVWSVVSGVLMIVAGWRMHGPGRWWLVLSGAVSVLWGALLWLSPVDGAVVLTWWLGVYALVFGFALLVLAFRLRGRRPA